VNTVFTQLREYIVETTKIVKARLGEVNEREIHLEITASGRVDGDVLISFRVGGSWMSNTVEGGDLEAVLTEYLRRKGWKQRNNPLMLSNSGALGEAHED